MSTSCSSTSRNPAAIRRSSARTARSGSTAAWTSAWAGADTGTGAEAGAASGAGEAVGTAEAGEAAPSTATSTGSSPARAWQNTRRPVSVVIGSMSQRWAYSRRVAWSTRIPPSFHSGQAMATVRPFRRPRPRRRSRASANPFR